MFDKKLCSITKAPIATVAQERRFYEDEEERKLALHVETPANDVIDKLIVEPCLTSKERRDLAVYVATMIKRVPAHRLKAQRLLPAALEEVRQIARAGIAERVARFGLNASVVAEELAQADQIISEFHAAPPQPILDYIKAPWPTEDVVKIILGMTWRLIKPPKWEFFITSDNPAVFEPFGLASAESELILPLSPKWVLHGSFQRGPTLLLIQPVQSTAVKVINRRIAGGATRFAFCHENAEWVLRLLRKGVSVYNPMRFVGKAVQA
jgi:hypothetical protein